MSSAAAGMVAAIRDETWKLIEPYLPFLADVTGFAAGTVSIQPHDESAAHGQTYARAAGFRLAAGDIVRCQRLVGTPDTPGEIVVLDRVLAGTTGEAVVSTSELVDRGVTTGKIALGAVNTGELADRGITTGKIALGAVNTGELADRGITTGKIALGAVNTGELADNAVSGAKIAARTIGTDRLVFGAVNTGELADGAVSPAKLDRAYALASHPTGLGVEVSNTTVLTDATVLDLRNGLTSSVYVSGGYREASIQPVYGTAANTVAEGNHGHAFVEGAAVWTVQANGDVSTTSTSLQTYASGTITLPNGTWSVAFLASATMSHDTSSGVVAFEVAIGAAFNSDAFSIGPGGDRLGVEAAARGTGQSGSLFWSIKYKSNDGGTARIYTAAGIIVATRTA